MNFNFALSFLTAVLAVNVNGLEEPSALRAGTSDADARHLTVSDKEGFGEMLKDGVCKGAVCGAWGDPHQVTCDGVKYDCQAVGLFTLMENHMFNIQAAFVGIAHHEEKNLKTWGLPTASIINDVVVDYKDNDAVPKIQLGFGELLYPKDVNYVADDQGCETGVTYVKKVNNNYFLDFAQKKRKNKTLEQCRALCKDKGKKCKKFQRTNDGSCYLIDANMEMRENPSHWAKVISGSMTSDCGVPVDALPLVSDQEVQKHGLIGDIECPLLMYIDNELVDISSKANGGQGFLWGKQGDANYVLQKNDKIHIVTKAPLGGSAEIQLKLKGYGPGKKWQCHWDFYVCLPESEENNFKELGSIGLLGSPDGNKANDWRDREGLVLPILNYGSDKHTTMTDYCVDNWCVSQNTSIMTYHGNKDFSNYKCDGEKHIPFNPEAPETCVDFGADQAILYCQNYTASTAYTADYESCIMDCCNAACPTDDGEWVRHEDPDDVPDKPKVVFPEEVGCTSESDLPNNKDTICPNTSVVTLLKQTGVQDIPDDGTIFYDIAFGEFTPGPELEKVHTVTFKINNPFEVKADVYVKHDKQALINFVEPTCDFQPDSHGCDANTEDITVVCHNYDHNDDGAGSFALVQVYFVSLGVDDGLSDESGVLGEQAVVDKCCAADPMVQPNTGVVEYVFEVQCRCPTTVA